MISIGVDLVNIRRIEAALARWGERFAFRIYTETEWRYCRGRTAELAVRFAAKEAVMKALGTGRRGVGWREIEVLSDRRGKPLVYLHGRGQQRAEQLGLKSFAISLAHSEDLAIAMVVAGDTE
ncbi:MAG: holo-ACP synthase [Chloroflexi bacterium]|nr:holo-ACP synthase [Chloroflexota bacterium]